MIHDLMNHAKITPNNPSANLLAQAEIVKILSHFNGMVVLDEAYIDFCGSEGMLPALKENQNLILLRTLSKAWGLAGIRLGMALADPEVIQYMNRVKYPYNVNYLTQTKALEMLSSSGKREEWVKLILEERRKLAEWLEDIDYVLKIFPSDANFLLVKVKDPDGLYTFLNEHGVIVRNRSHLTHCQGCIRITVGTPDENRRLSELMKSYPQ